MHLTVSKSKNSTSFYMLQSLSGNGKHTTKIVEKLGTEEQIRSSHPGVDPYEWANAKYGPTDRSVRISGPSGSE